MQRQKLTPAQKAAIEKDEERRRHKRRQWEAEYRRRVERLRRQIEEARKRRQRLMLRLLLAILAIQESILAAFQRSFTYQPDSNPDTNDWTPDPTRDYAPRHGHDDHIDGYSYEQWTRMTAERGIQISRKAELKAQWEGDPERENFPQRYQEWGYKPFLTEIINDLSETRYQPAALTGLKLMAPAETHQYLQEVYAIQPLDLLHCRAELSVDIINNFRRHAIGWEEQKRREGEEARMAKNEKKTDDDGKSFDP